MIQLTEKDFDDVVVETNGSIWSQCCSDHVNQCGAFCTSDNAVDTICGVRGCDKVADYYVDFTPDFERLNDSCAPDGWGVFYNTETDAMEIQKVDDVNCFTFDDDAIEYVVSQFLRYPKQSAYHIAIKACIDSDRKLQPFVILDEMTLFYVRCRLDSFEEKVYGLNVHQKRPNGAKIFQGYGSLFLDFPVPSPNTACDYVTDFFKHETTPLTASCQASEHYNEYDLIINGKTMVLSRHELYELKNFINSIPV